MFKLRNLRDIGLVLAGALAGAIPIRRYAAGVERVPGERHPFEGAIIIEKDKTESIGGPAGQSRRVGTKSYDSSSYYQACERFVAIVVAITKTVARPSWTFGSTAAC